MNEPYNGMPGFKASGTSEDAAQAIAGIAVTLREKIYHTLLNCIDSTPDEMANLLRVSVLSVRPRFSELVAAGMIVDTGLRRTNSSGHKAVVYSAVHVAQARPKKRKMVAIGNPTLWGEFMRTIYNHAGAADKANAKTEMLIAAEAWSMDMSNRLKHHQAGHKPDWMTPAEWAELQHISGAYSFHD